VDGTLSALTSGLYCCSEFVKEFFYWYDHKKSRQNEQMEQGDGNGM